MRGRTYFRGNVRRNLLAAVAAALIIDLVVIVAWPDGSAPSRVSLTVVDRAVEAGEVRRAVIDDDARTIEVERTDGSVVRAAYPTTLGAVLAERLLADGVEVTVEPAAKVSLWVRFGVAVLPILLIVGVFFLYIRRVRSGASAFGKGRGKAAQTPTDRFSDIGGLDEVVAELAEVRDYLQHAERFAASGARAPQGFLLTGPPGTGKTMLARALAGEAGVPFFAMSGSDFVETFAGVGAARVRRLFELARKHDRAIIFIDEIDAVGKSRSAATGGDTDERERTLNQLLVEMDGFTKSNVLVLAATNRADILDPALLRPGRFDRTIQVPLPDRRGRTRILELLAMRHEIASDVDFVELARRTSGMTGAQLAALVNEAALAAARAGQRVVNAHNIHAALATIVLGRERPTALVTERDRRITAWHESGHAVCALLLDDVDDPVQVTIVPRGGAGGATWLTTGDDQFVTRAQARARLLVAMGGRGAEELLLDGDFTSGASQDYAGARALATSMVTRFGMGQRGVAHVGYAPGEPLPQEVEAAVNDLLEDSLAAARALLFPASQLLEAMAVELLVDETILLPRLRELVRRWDEEGGVIDVVELGSAGA